MKYCLAIVSILWQNRRITENMEVC